MTKWWARVAAVLTTAVLSVFVPVAAWAAGNEVVVEAAKKKSKGFGFVGIGGLLCCLVVLGVIGVVVFVIMKKKRK